MAVVLWQCLVLFVVVGKLSCLLLVVAKDVVVTESVSALIFSLGFRLQCE